MTYKGAQRRLDATESGPRPGRFPLGSALSRATARALLAARNAKERGETGFKVVYRADGSVKEMRGLADALKAARMRHEAGDSSEWLPQSGQARISSEEVTRNA